MTPEIITALAGAFVLVLGAIGALWVKIRSLTLHMNSRLDDLLAVTKAKAYAEGGADERERATGKPKPGRSKP